MLCLDDVRIYTKEKMLSEGIPFIVLGKQPESVKLTKGNTLKDRMAVEIFGTNLNELFSPIR